MSNPVRVLVVDDHPLVVKGIIATLSEAEQVEVIGFAYNGTAALDMCRKLMPDIVLLDLHLPDMDGITLLKRMKEDATSTRMVMFTWRSAHF